MLMIAVALDLLAAAGLCALAAKYTFGPAPAGYHAEILRGAGHDVDETVKRLFGGINAALGGGFFALAAALAAMTLFGIYHDALWAKVAVVITGLLAGVPSALAVRSVEQHTGVKTPWRPAVILTAVLVVAFALSLI